MEDKRRGDGGEERNGEGVRGADRAMGERGGGHAVGVERVRTERGWGRCGSGGWKRERKRKIEG